MKCPLLMPRWIGMPELIKDAQVKCVKEECAWWDGEDGVCVMGRIASELFTINAQLKLLLESMPHEA